MLRYLTVTLLICIAMHGSIQQAVDAGDGIAEEIESEIVCADSISSQYDRSAVGYLDINVMPERDTYLINESVDFSVTIMNSTDKDITFSTHVGIYDLQITNMTGAVAFRRPVPTNQVYCTIGAGLKITIQYSASIGLSPGTYTVTTSLPMGSAVSAEFRVIEPPNGKRVTGAGTVAVLHGSSYRSSM